jgi:hypothetical protein
MAIRLTLVFILCSSLFSCSTATKERSEDNFYNPKPPVPSVGQLFRYKHSGPIPWGSGSPDVSGLRIVQVTDRDETKKLWKIEERFEASEGSQSGFYTDLVELTHVVLHSRDSQLRIVYNPPLTIRYPDLLLDQERTFVSKQTFFAEKSGVPIGTATLTDITRRESYDERLITPVGAYLCRRFVSRIRIDANLSGVQTLLSGTVYSYWCDTIGWFVKEECSFSPMIVNGKEIGIGYKTSSVLESFEPMN